MPILKDFILLGGNVGQVWIIRVYFLLALVSPLVCKVAEFGASKKNWIILLSFFIIINEIIAVFTEVNTGFFYDLIKGIIVYTLGFSIVEIIALLSKKGELRLLLIFSVITLLISTMVNYYFFGFSWPNEYKYPPRAMFLFYGIVISLLFLLLLRNVKFQNNKVHDGIVWVSKNSLWIYFWHRIPLHVIGLFGLNTPWWINYIIAICVSFALTAMQNLTIKKSRKFVMKKVLIVASVISFIEWFNKENLEFLHNNLGFQVHLACNLDYMEDTDVERTKGYIEKLRRDGIILHNINFSRSPLSKQNINAYKQLKTIIDENFFDLIHCHTPTASMITRLAARKSRRQGTKVMYSCHGFHFHNAAPKKNWLIYYPIEKWLSRFCDYIVTINKEDYNRAKTFHCPNVRYIPGVGVNINKIKDCTVDKIAYKKSIGVPADCTMILSVGELIERKNHEVIIRALGQLKRKDIYYVVCGKGPLRDYLEELARKLSIEQNVIFLGFRRDIPELCNTTDISAFPSRIEGLGLAGIEAMAAGVPLISSNVHGILDYVVDGKTGFACSPNDVKAFAKAIETLSDNQALREEMKMDCLEAVRPFEFTNALNVMWSIYKEILNGEE